jgi:hypothetical protein
MNPYLEQEGIWHDFHGTFIPAVREMLVSQVRPHYIAGIGDQVYVQEMPADQRPVLGRAVDIEHFSFLEIRDRDSHQLITILELLNPSKKQLGPHRERYVAKRQQLLAGSVHFVEVDLLRGGPRIPTRPLPPCDYYALVSRVEKRPNTYVWPIHLRDHLPTIPIPLRCSQADARLDLQAVLDRIYDAAGYQDYIYEGQPQPRLSVEDEAWARQFLPAT